MKDITNQLQSKTDSNLKTKKQARDQRERRERGPPADGIPSKTKVMVANLPYDLTEEKVRAAASSMMMSSLIEVAAHRIVQGLRAFVRQNCAPTDSPIYDQKAPGSRRSA